MKSLSRYLHKILSRSLLLVFILLTLFGFLMAVGVHAATSEQSSLDARRMNSGAIKTKSSLKLRTCAGFNLLVRVDGLSLCSRVSVAGREARPFHSPQIIAQADTQLQNGQSLYQAGQFLQAANVWKAAASSFQSKGDSLNQALVLSYLSLTYQQLGQPQQAETAMNEAVTLITAQTLPQSKFILAQILNNQGQLQLTQGKPEAALETWKKSETLYRELSDSEALLRSRSVSQRSADRTGEIGTQLNQARALQALGFYLRARSTLEQVEASLKSQPASSLKVSCRTFEFGQRPARCWRFHYLPKNPRAGSSDRATTTICFGYSGGFIQFG